MSSEIFALFSRCRAMYLKFTKCLVHSSNNSLYDHYKASLSPVKNRWIHWVTSLCYYNSCGKPARPAKRFFLILIEVFLILVLLSLIVLFYRGHKFSNLAYDWPGSWSSCYTIPIGYYFKTVNNPKRLEVCSDLVLKAAERGRRAHKAGLEIMSGKRQISELDGCSMAKGGPDGIFNGSAGIPLRSQETPCKLVWVTYSTECGANLGRVADICDYVGIELYVLGLHEFWMGWGGRTRLIREAIYSFPPDRVVFSSDADDVLLLPTASCSPPGIISSFASVGAPVALTAERYCYPDSDLSGQYPEAPGNSPFRYVNAGSYIGYAWAIRDLMGEAYEGDCSDDQRQLTKVFLRNVSYVGVPDLSGERQIVDKSFSGSRNPYAKLDWSNKVILAMGGSEEIEYDLTGYKSNGTVRITVTDSTPCFFHQNGDKKETRSHYVALPHLMKEIGIDDFLRSKGYRKS